MQRGLFLAGKLAVQGRVNAVCPGSLLFVKDVTTGVQYLVDCGASVSMLPGPTSSSSSAPPLKTANGGRIATGAEQRVRLQLLTSSSVSQFFTWDFLYGNVEGPILGNDFLKANHLSVDPASACMRHLPSGVSFPGKNSFVLGGAAAAVLPADISQLLQQFPSVVQSGSQLPPPIHDVQHHLETTGPPVTARFRRLDSSKLAAAKKIFADWEKCGIVRRSSSAWASPLHMVAKKDGSWRPCGDFRRLNNVTSADKYPVPNMGDFTGQIEGCSIFSTLDLKNGYLQVPLHPAAIPKTALITPFGLFEFVRMPFGLKNAGMSFQRLMDRIMSGLPFVFVYIDDILVASPDPATHLEHLRAVLDKLQNSGLVLNLDKCVFSKSAVNFLGHRISAAGSSPLPDKVAAIAGHPAPNNVKELQQFLGMINFYRKYLPAAARFLCPLTNALKGGPSGSTLLTWTPEMQTAFETAKATLAAATCLAHPVPNATLSLVCDASSSHVGAVLQQQLPNQSDFQPLGFFSKKLDKPQLAYSAFDRELFAAYAAIRHFRYQLEGRTFTLWTDHKPLIYSVKRSDEAWTPRQQRQTAYIAEYTNDVRHIAGQDNVVADTLSRPPAAPAVNLVRTAISLPGAISRAASLRSTNVCSDPGLGPGCSPPSPVPVVFAIAPATGGPVIDLAALAVAQKSCPDTQRLISSQLLSIVQLQTGAVSLACDTSTGALRPLVPLDFRQTIFLAVHGLAHPGIRATRRLISSRWVWPKMSSDVAAWCRDCQNCQRGKVTRQPKAPLQAFTIPVQRFSHIHVDLVGPLPRSDGMTHLLTIIDRSTRWLEAVPLSSTTASAVADALIAGWICRFGVPAELTSDRGVQFTSEVWALLMNRLGIRHNLTTAYHPQANGMVERSHRQLKDALRSRLAGPEWCSHLPWVLFSLRATPKEDSNLSSAELVYGSPLVLPGQLPNFPAVSLPPKQLHPTSIPTRAVHLSPSEVRVSPALWKAEFVYIRRGGVAPPLSPAYSGPFAVIQRSAKFFKLDYGDRTDFVSVDRLKPHMGNAPLQPAVAVRRGRPPLSALRPPTSSLGAGSCSGPN